MKIKGEEMKSIKGTEQEKKQRRKYKWMERRGENEKRGGNGRGNKEQWRKDGAGQQEGWEEGGMKRRMVKKAKGERGKWKVNDEEGNEYVKIFLGGWVLTD